MRNLVIAVLIVMPSSAWAAFGFKLEASGLNREEATRIEIFLKEVETKVPALMKSTLDQVITVRFQAFEKEKTPLKINCENEEGDRDRALSDKALPFTAGRATRNRRGLEIVLNQRMISEITSGELSSRKFSCGHHNFYRYAQASLLHETAHHYDGVARVSSRPQFMALTGWDSSYENKNALPKRSPDGYEFRNPEETMAVEFEYFAIDPEFECRRPALYAYFVREFGERPFPLGSCKKNNQIQLAGSDESVAIDPARIYAVHYFHVGKGDSLVSRFGHSMIRLVVCAPERTVVGPECEKDVSSHLVAGFQANVSDLKIDLVKGLTGKYPSRLYFFRLPDALDNYNDRELREIESVPLKMTDAQKEMIAAQLVDRYWSYEGRYRWIGNNCATEAQALLKASFEDSHPVQKERKVYTPGGLLESLGRSELVQRDLPTDLNTLLEQGYYFPSRQKGRLEQAFRLLSSALEQLPLGSRARHPQNVDEYLQKTSASERRAWWKELEAAVARSPGLAAAFFQLEVQIYQFWSDQYRATLSGVLLRESEKDPVLAKKIRSFTELLQGLAPWDRLYATGSYGIPAEDEINPCAKQAVAMTLDQSNLERLGDLLTAELTEVRDELRATSENLEDFLKRMNSPMP